MVILKKCFYPKMQRDKVSPTLPVLSVVLKSYHTLVLKRNGMRDISTHDIDIFLSITSGSEVQINDI